MWRLKLWVLCLFHETMSRCKHFEASACPFSGFTYLIPTLLTWYFTYWLFSGKNVLFAPLCFWSNINVAPIFLFLPSGFSTLSSFPHRFELPSDRQLGKGPSMPHSPRTGAPPRGLDHSPPMQAPRAWHRDQQEATKAKQDMPIITSPKAHHIYDVGSAAEQAFYIPFQKNDLPNT